MAEDNKLDELLENLLCRAYTKIIYGEEKALKNIIGNNLSLKEYHTLDIVDSLSKSNNNTISEISKYLSITLSTCTINVDRLIQKGYLNKIKKDLDKRVAYIELTERGRIAREQHENMHKLQVQNMVENLSLTEKVALFNAVNKLDL